MSSRLSRLLTGLVVAAGVGAVLVGLGVFVEAWQASRAWAGSGDAQHANLPAEAPVWLDEPATARAEANAPATTPLGSPDGDVVAGAAAESDAGQPGAAVAAPGAGSQTPGVPVARADVAPGPGPGLGAPGSGGPGGGAGSMAPVADSASAGTGPSAYQSPGQQQPSSGQQPPAPGEVAVAEIDFRFLDPPEPGAHARLAVTIVNEASVPSGPFSVILPTRWLQDFTVLGAVPEVLDDRPEGEAERRFEYPGVAAGARQTVELHVLATAEELDGPDTRVLLNNGTEIGRGRPRTVAPRPRPGPARAVAIPKLGVQAAVIPVPWEPPSFVVGQVLGSAAVSEGNTVLIGHLAGPWGDVFARLDRLRPGDEVVATSRGLEYKFIVSEIAVRPFDDVTATQPTGTPRLTLMTCTGQWSILRQDYSHRLWVVAEPPELAQQTILANAERAAQAAREADAAAAERAAHEAEVNATAAAAAIPAQATAQTQTQVQTAVAQPAVTAAQEQGQNQSQGQPVAAGAQEQGRGSGAPQRAAPTTAVPAAAALPAASPVSGERERAPGTAPDPASVPVPVPASAVADEPTAPGIVIESPTEGTAVSTRLTVRGRRTLDAEPDRPLWLLVRADAEGSRWYALDRPLTVDERGWWEATVDLGGPAGVRHELRVGVVDAAGDAALRRHAAEQRGQPLDSLPTDFRTGARVVVERR